MKDKVKSREKQIKELLESDDELPDDYIDTPYIPAYLNDDRFKLAQFNWKDISNKQLGKTDQSQYYKQMFMKKGILSKRDIFLSRCIEKSDGATLLWFVNFLLLKDLQSNYQFLTSCLVPNIQYDWCGKSDARTEVSHRNNPRYKIIVKE